MEAIVLEDIDDPIERSLWWFLIGGGALAGLTSLVVGIYLLVSLF